MKQQLKSIVNYILIILALLIMVVVTILGSAKFLNSTPLHPVIILDDGWTVSHGSYQYTNTTLSSMTIGVVNKGDTLTISNTLPQTNAVNPTLVVRSMMSAISIYIGNQEVYNYGHDLLNQNLPAAKIFHAIALPEDYVGQKVTIVYVGTDKDSFSGVTPVYIGDYNDISEHILQHHRYDMFIGIFLFVLGVILMVLSPIILIKENHNFSIFFSALTSIIFGGYILCFNDILVFFTDHAQFYTTLEYVFLYLIPPSILCFIMSSSEEGAKDKINRVLLGFDIVFNIAAISMHLLNVVHISSFLEPMHIISLLEGVYVIATTLRRYIIRLRNQGENVIFHHRIDWMLTAILLFMICAVADIVKYNLNKYLGKGGEANSDIAFMTVGALCFIMCLMLNYFFQCIDHITSISVKSHLEGLAYSDALTGLSNRARCEQMITQAEGLFTIISFDLDHLKFVNDHFGHSEGDKLISHFSDVLSVSFNDASLIGRMGGDEFVVILPYVDSKKLLAHLNFFDEALSQKVEGTKFLKCSASYGYACSNDEKLKHNPSGHNAYMLADSRMYATKKKHHNDVIDRICASLTAET